MKEKRANDKKKETGVFLSGMNEAVFDACKRLGVPLAAVQKLVLSKDWREVQRARAAEKLQQIGGAK